MTTTDGQASPSGQIERRHHHRRTGTLLRHHCAIQTVDDRRLVSMVERYCEHGYARFDAVGRRTYNEFTPAWPDAGTPRAQLPAERSYPWSSRDEVAKIALMPTFGIRRTFGRSAESVGDHEYPFIRVRTGDRGCFDGKATDVAAVAGASPVGECSC